MLFIIKIYSKKALSPKVLKKERKKLIGKKIREVYYPDDWTRLIDENWIITDILGDGKFKAVLEKDWKKYNFNVSDKEALGRMKSIGTAEKEG